MHINTLSNGQQLSSLHNSTEGNFNRVLNLLLLTNKESAYRVIKQNKFTSETREFGKGLYFVENVEESEIFDIEDKAVVLCEVFVGVSLILTRPDQNIKDKFLKEKNCDSVKGYLSLTQKYYVIYNYKKVRKVIALKANESIVRNSEVAYKCTNYLCKFHGQRHADNCKLLCKVKSCKFFSGYHEPPCELKCEKVNCEDFNTFHKNECKLRCTWENCIMFGKYHEQKCIHLDHEDKSEKSEPVVYNKNRISNYFSNELLKKSKKSSKKKRNDLRTAKMEKNNFFISENEYEAWPNRFYQDAQNKCEVRPNRFYQESENEYKALPNRFYEEEEYRYEESPNRFYQEPEYKYDAFPNRLKTVKKAFELSHEKRRNIEFNQGQNKNFKIPELNNVIKPNIAKKNDLKFEHDLDNYLVQCNLESEQDQKPEKKSNLIPIIITAVTVIILGILVIRHNS